jgi:putative beta barrel porin BBP7
MRYSFLGSIAVLLAGAGLAVAQPWLGSKHPATASAAPAADAPAAQPAPPPAAMPSNSLPPPVWSKPELPTADCGDNCGPDCCPKRMSCCEDRLWLSGGYILMWPKHSPIPPLVTTGVEGEPPGAIGQPDTAVLVGGHVEYPGFSGLRLSGGYAIDDLKRHAIEAGYFMLGRRERVYTFASDAGGNPAISRPFFAQPDPALFPDLFPGEDIHSVSRPELFSGSVRVGMKLEMMGAEVNCTHSLVDVGPLAVDALLGGRWVYLREELDIRDRTLSIGGDLFFNGEPLGVFNPDTETIDSTGFAVSTHDHVRTTNHFYGAQIGLRGEYNCDCWYFGGKLKCAIGATHHTVEVDGDTTAIFPDGTTAQTQGGVLALATNIGKRSSDSFAVIPEVELNVGVYLNERVRVYAGYNFMYWSSVVRPGEQLDHTINPAFLPTADPLAFGSSTTPAFPRPLLQKSDFYMHGITTGIEVHY